MNASIVSPRRGIRQRIRLTAHKYIAILYVSVVNNLTYLTEVVFRSFFLIIFVYIFLQLWTVTYTNCGLSSWAVFASVI